jgi:hypothetical protein
LSVGAHIVHHHLPRQTLAARRRHQFPDFAGEPLATPSLSVESS